MINVVNKVDCCGCEACFNACPKNSIEMIYDEEGFLYPKVNSDTCVNCGLCEKVCPIINHTPREKNDDQEAYLLQHKDDEICRQSTAGGAFTGIATYVMEHGGIVFGVEMTENYKVRHTSVETVEELKKFRNSKYVQSRIGYVYQQVKTELQSKRMVCFSGTPCQIEGLRHYLGKEYENLILVDVVCHAVPSPLIFEKYMQYMEHKLNAKIDRVRFRDKHYGYKNSTMNLVTVKNRRYNGGSESDPWLRAYFGDVIDRPSCYSCKFKSQYRASDFTIWDCFTPEKFDKGLDNGLGVTRVLIHTNKGKQLFEQIKNSYEFVKVQPSEIVVKNSAMFQTVKIPDIRKDFFYDANKMDGITLFDQYYPITAIYKLKKSLRVILYRTNLNGFVKKVLLKIRGKY